MTSQLPVSAAMSCLARCHTYLAMDSNSLEPYAKINPSFLKLLLLTQPQESNKASEMVRCPLRAPVGDAGLPTWWSLGPSSSFEK